MSIRLFVGLGNPGAQYEATRHNAGFWMVEAYARAVSALWKSNKDFKGRVARDGERWLLMPQTFMNLSGQSVGALAHFYKIRPEEVLVAHDELDLDPGVARLKKGGGHGGHNGIRDISAQLGDPGFWRLRIGIGHPRTRGVDQAVENYVLHTPGRSEQAILDEAIERAGEVLPDALEGRMEAAMMKLHTKP